MILSDNETTLDLLNNRVIAETIVSTILSTAPEPITIGVHGDWGAGKSSILKMIQQNVERNEDVLCLHFNGWLFQGFEDSKIILIETIVHELLQARPNAKKVKDAAKNVLAKLDWLRIAKQAGGLAWTAFTGAPSPGQLSGMVDMLKGLLPTETSDISPAEVEKAIEQIGSTLQSAESRHVSREILEFRDSLQELLNAAKVKQLIVLIDDLDRCLPETSIDVLEALRLFLLIPGAAFVIAADEVMIEYAVKKHFPDLPYSEKAQNYTRNYLEKLINIPFRLSPLGIAETQIYVTLLLLMSELSPSDPRFEAIAARGKELTKTPWNCAGFKREDFEIALSTNVFPDIDPCLAMGTTLGKTLAQGTKGNPRQIKRFLNTFLLRKMTAVSRGLSELIDPNVLVKLMLVEQFLPITYTKIIEDVTGSDAGISLTIKSEEKSIETLQKHVPPIPTVAEEKDSSSPEKQNFKEWTTLPPSLGSIDLRPYLFIARDGQRIAFENAGTSNIEHLATQLMESKIQAAQAVSEIKARNPSEIIELCGLLHEQILGADKYKKKPNGIDGFITLAETRNEARIPLFNLLESIPPDKVGIWITTGWGKCFETPEEKERLKGLMMNFLDCSKSENLKNAFRLALKNIK